MSAPLILVRNESPAAPMPALACVDGFREKAKAANTHRAYRADWEHFAHWCRTRGRAALPATPDTVAWYLAENAAQLKVATLQRRLAAISKAHQAAGVSSPTSRSHAVVRETWKGIRRVHGIAQAAKSPLLPADLRRIAAVLPPGLSGARDRALLLLGFAGALRRSELVGLNVEDLDFREEGLVITVRRSKTDQEGEGRGIGIPYGSDPATCPFRAVHAWIRLSGIGAGVLFRPVDRYENLGVGRLSDKSVALLVKRFERDRERPLLFLGAGLVTAAALAGVSERSIMAQTGHRSADMVRRYVRGCSLFQDNAAARTGL